MARKNVPKPRMKKEDSFYATQIQKQFKHWKELELELDNIYETSKGFKRYKKKPLKFNSKSFIGKGLSDL